MTGAVFVEKIRNKLLFFMYRSDCIMFLWKAYHDVWYSFDMKRVAFCICLIVCSLFLLLSCATTEGGNTAFPASWEGRCITRDGKSVKLDSEYYLIYYAASWCPYCREYQESLKETAHRLRRMYGNVMFIFAGHERDVSDEDLLSFLEEGDYDFPYVPVRYREETGIMKLVSVPKFWIPGFVLLDREGRVLASSSGETKDDYYRDRPLSYYEGLQICDCIITGV